MLRLAVSQEPLSNKKEVSAEERLNGFWEHQARRVARDPCAHPPGSHLLALLLLVIGLVVGDFSISSKNGGWESRGVL